MTTKLYADISARQKCDILRYKLVEVINTINSISVHLAIRFFVNPTTTLSLLF